MAYSIYIGSLTQPSFYFEQPDTFQVRSTQKVALVGKELTVDTFEPIVEDSIDNLRDVYHFRSSDGQEIETATGEIFVLSIGSVTHDSPLINLAYGTPVWYYRESELLGKFYISNVERTAKNKYLLRCVSVIGLLEKMVSGGGLFTATTFQAVLSHILASGVHGTGSEVITYKIDDDVAALPVSGWLPKDTKRNNLYRLIFANGVNIVKDADGDPRFTFIFSAPQSPVEIPTVELYDAGTQEYEKPYSQVVVSEHTYTALTDQSEVTLFDNSSGSPVTAEEIWFTNAPIIVSTLAVDGELTIVSATENSAILTGSGKLTGIPYTHTVRSITSEVSGGDSDKTARVENCTTVNSLNSENLLARLRAYYQPDGLIKTIRNSIVYTDQRVGKAYKFLSPFDEETVAYLTAMDINASVVFKADCEWRANYGPAGQAGLYQHVIVLDADTYAEDGGTFSWPDGAVPEQCKVVLIGGGTGGSSGWPGYNGKDARTYIGVDQSADLSGAWYGAEGGSGGDGGSGGAPGRVKVVTIENPASTYAYTIGAGGAGGAATGYRPDTVAELRAALENENPEAEYTDAQIEELIASEATDWSGNPNAGTAGTATTFSDGNDSWSTADNDGYVPTGGVYEPITDEYYALTGNKGVKGGKGGARKVENEGSFNWIIDGEDVTGPDGVTYRGGRTGTAMTKVDTLPEAKFLAYGGNGAGAAVGLDRDDHEHMDGGSDQTAEWQVIEE